MRNDNLHIFRSERLFSNYCTETSRLDFARFSSGNNHSDALIYYHLNVDEKSMLDSKYPSSRLLAVAMSN